MNTKGEASVFANWVRPATILLLAICVYAPAMPGHFFMDDFLVVRDNPLVASPDLITTLTSDYWGPDANTGLYRPLTILSFAFNHVLLGSEPWGYHLANVLLHAGVSLMLYVFLGTLGAASGVRWLAAALFAVHPIHGEAVNELVGRSELLVALFLLLALWLAQTRARMHLLTVSLCFAAALLSKEHAIVLIALLPVIDLYLKGRSREFFRSRAPLYALLTLIAGAWFLLRHFGVKRPGSGPDCFDPYFVPLSTLDFPSRLLSALKVQALYLSKMVVPYHLQGYYPSSTVLPPVAFISLWGVLIAALAGLLCIGARVGWRERHLWGLAIILYAISFSPTANIFVLTAVTMSERLAYLPSIWFCLGLASAASWAFAVVSRKRLATGGGVFLIVVYAAAGFARNVDFRTPERLWKADLRINPDNELSMLFLGDEKWRLGKLQEAEKVFLRLLEIAPKFSDAHHAYAKLLIDLGRPAEAIPYAQRSVEYQAGKLAPAYMTLATAYLKTGKPNEALGALENLRGMFRNRAFYWETKGKVLEGRQDLLGALECYRKEMLATGPRSTDTLQRTGSLLVRLGQYAEAERVLRQDLTEKNNAPSWNSLGVALALQGKFEEARKAFGQAVLLDPSVEQYRVNLEKTPLEAERAASLKH